MFPYITFAPTIEPKDTPDAFLNASVDSIMRSGNFNRVPWIVGFAEDEGVALSPISNHKIIYEYHHKISSIHNYLLATAIGEKLYRVK
jgi:hypothetical protein